jgi:hypothetical protein
MSKTAKTRPLTNNQKATLFELLRQRFEENMVRHEGPRWPDVQKALEAKPRQQRALHEMEASGGEPDVVGRIEDSGEYLFMDCSPQSPVGRRSVCYDRRAREARKKHPPTDSAVEMAAAMGAELLTEAYYRRLQELGDFDTRTSSWLMTPPEIRTLGGALFGDSR